MEGKSLNHATNNQEAGSPVQSVGFWSAVLATACSLLHVIGQIGEWLGWLGSQGGPNSSSTVTGLVILLTPSLFLGSAFLILIVSIHQITPIHKKIWSQLAVVFATAYTVLISTVYFVQLTLVAPRIAQGRIDGIEMFLFVPFDSYLYAVDLLGYSFMSLATLFASRVFVGGGLLKVIRLFLTANGFLIPFLVLQMYYHPLLWIASLWAVTFPVSTWALAIFFRKDNNPFIV